MPTTVDIPTLRSAVAAAKGTIPKGREGIRLTPSDGALTVEAGDPWAVSYRTTIPAVAASGPPAIVNASDFARLLKGKGTLALSACAGELRWA